jgi:hypothetical protein
LFCGLKLKFGETAQINVWAKLAEVRGISHFHPIGGFSCVALSALQKAST